MEWFLILIMLIWIVGIIYGQDIASRLSFKNYLFHIAAQAIAISVIATVLTLSLHQIFITVLFFFAFNGGIELGRSIEKDYSHGVMSL